ncbi:hypothetical protein [Amycolatopsis marina]|uniref:hypothetical protein n=1 Tax=Amycolatopsis marina TaxID=490629 RepID=UPI000B84F594|nr:hypothetical protein [Amycolatopsis marina]
MTYQPAQPARGGSVSAGAASDAKTFGAAALLTFSAGMVVLLGYLLVGGFGAFLGIIGAVFGIVWWKGLHGKVFPRDLPNSSVLGAAVASAVLALVVVMLA